jgi:KipI family sensor histidine kinase inhibitor
MLPSDDSLPDVAPAGDSALLVTFGRIISPQIHAQVRNLAQTISQDPLPGVGEAVPGYATLLVHYDPQMLDWDIVEAWVRQKLTDTGSVEQQPVHLVEIPVYYGGAYGPDLADVAAVHHLSPQEVIRIHAAGEYPVYMMGFTPGFPYLGGMDPSISTPRLKTPRSRVPAGSVGIAGEQTGIYPVDSPGGWRLIGWTPLRLYDPDRNPPFLLSPGDVVRFVAVEEGTEWG